MNRVKIVATIGPRTNDPRSLLRLRRAGMDVARLNGSHAALDWHAQTIALLREILPDVPILLDVPGRKVRTGQLAAAITFAAGDEIVLSTDEQPDALGRPKVSVTYAGLHADVAANDVILMDDGTLRLTVLDVAGKDVVCRAETGGTIRSGKGIHVPDVTLGTDFLSERDTTLISFARRQGVDFLGISFVDGPSHVEAVRALAGKDGPAIIAKVETQGALDHLADLVKVSDALMIDRGDLSVETSLESIPLFQKHILAEARRGARPVIVATEMLHSMTEHPVPTKAEVSDITTAVLDGASALMLSGETAVGKYPVEAVSLMRRVADKASAHMQASLDETPDSSVQTVPGAMGDAIALICRRLQVTKIVAITLSGYAARMIAARMPRQPILAVSNHPASARSFNLLRGVTGVYVDVPFSRTSMAHIPQCLEALWKDGALTDDDLILVTAVGYPKSGNRMNLIETHKVVDLKESLKWSATRKSPIYQYA